MAITPSLGAIWRPYESAPPTEQTPLKNDALWTVTSGETTGGLNVVGSAASSNELYVNYLGVSIFSAAAASLVKFYIGTDQIGQLATGATGHIAMPFGAPGIMGGTTTTATVSVVSSGGDVNMYCVCAFQRKI